MKTITIGSRSQKKLNYVKEVLDNLDIEGYTLDKCQVLSEAPPHPKSVEESMQSAIDITKKTFETQRSNITIGLQGGMIMYNGSSRYVCVAAALYNQKSYIGFSSKLPIPKAIHADLEKGHDLKKCIKKYIPQTESEETLTKMIAFREDLFKESLINLFLQLQLELN